MANAPVYYVLAQAKFAPVAAMGDKFINEIQDQLRREGYPLFEQQNIAQLQLISSPGEVEPKVAHSVSWLITKEDRTAGFILTTSSLAFHTTHYETNEKFIPELLHGLEIVHNVVKLGHISRLGLRYLDAVLPLANETIADYLVNGLHGIDFKAKKNYTLIESVFQTESGPLLSNGKLIARVLQLTSALLGYPSDLLQHGLVPMKRFKIEEPCEHAIIDIDHFVEGHMPLDFVKIKKQLLSLHTVIKEAFKATTTGHAEHAWS